MFEREVESDVSQNCQWADVGILPFFPLACGLLAGRYTRGEEPAQDSRAGSWGVNMRRYFDYYGTEAAYDAIEALMEFARARDHTCTTRDCLVTAPPYGQFGHRWCQQTVSAQGQRESSRVGTHTR